MLKKIKCFYNFSKCFYIVSHVKLLIMKLSNWLIYKHIVHTCAVTALQLARLHPMGIENKIERIVSNSLEMSRYEIIGTLLLYLSFAITNIWNIQNIDNNKAVKFLLI